MTVRHIAPRPPAESGVVEYAELLHAALLRQGQISWDRGPGVKLYHVGNNALHREIYAEALREPGVVVLHDAVLHHLMLGMLDEEAYIAEFVFNYGDWTAALARRLYRGRARSGSVEVYFRYPMLRRLVQCSLAIVVHNERAAAMVGSANVHVLPHLVNPVGDIVAEPNPRPRFGVFGHLRESKRLRSFLKAARMAEVEAVVAGRFADSRYEAGIAPLLEGVCRVPFGTHADFLASLAAVDVVVNLRSPSAGETSGVTLQAMALSKPVVVSASGEAKDFPEGLCAAVDEGPGEIEMLAATMIWLRDSAADRAAMGRAAKRYVAEVHAPERVGARLWRILENAGRMVT